MESAVTAVRSTESAVTAVRSPESAVTAVRSTESAVTAVRSPESAVTACVVARDEAESGAPTARHFEEGGSRGRRLLAQA
ncbi:MAG: hypothetical protein WBN14_12260, partial [Polyangiales bacterium]